MISHDLLFLTARPSNCVLLFLFLLRDLQSIVLLLYLTSLRSFCKLGVCSVMDPTCHTRLMQVKMANCLELRDIFYYKCRKLDFIFEYLGSYWLSFKYLDKLNIVFYVSSNKIFRHLEMTVIYFISKNIFKLIKVQ